jgi:hypothetical protein
VHLCLSHTRDWTKPRQARRTATNKSLKIITVLFSSKPGLQLTASGKFEMMAQSFSKGLLKWILL